MRRVILLTGILMFGATEARADAPRGDGGVKTGIESLLYIGFLLEFENQTKTNLLIVPGAPSRFKFWGYDTTNEGTPLKYHWPGPRGRAYRYKLRGGPHKGRMSLKLESGVTSDFGRHITGQDNTGFCYRGMSQPEGVPKPKPKQFEVRLIIGCEDSWGTLFMRLDETSHVIPITSKVCEQLDEGVVQLDPQGNVVRVGSDETR